MAGTLCEPALTLLVLLARSARTGVVAADLVAVSLEWLRLRFGFVRKRERFDIGRLRSDRLPEVRVLRTRELGAPLAFSFDLLLGDLCLFLRLDSNVHQD